MVERLLARDDAEVLVPALRLAAARRMTVAADRVFALLETSDKHVREAAYAALPYVTGPRHMVRLAGLLDAADGAAGGANPDRAVRTSAQLPADKRYGAIAGYMRASKIPARYYPVLAQTGTPEAVASLLAGFPRG